VSKSNRPVVLVASVLVLAGAGVAAFFLWPKPKTPPTPPADLAGAMAANTRGVGYMEHYQYENAEKEFAEAVRLAPEWTPAKIDLGIAVMNINNPEAKKRAGDIFREVLAREPDNKHAQYCLGILAFDAGDFQRAYEYFAAVNKLDPEDAHTWMRMGSTHPAGRESPESMKCFDEALKLDPYLNSARYGLAMALRVTEPDRVDKLLADRKALEEGLWESLSGIVYSEMGKYADVIGRDPSMASKPKVGAIPMFEQPAGFKVNLAPGAKWAAAADLDPLRRAARERFGGTMVLFDYNRDGKPDVLILSAVVENGKVRDLLLRNDGNNVFTDVTAEAGLATPRPSLGAAVGDFDNDGYSDLVITGAGEQHLFRNKGDGKFEDVTAAAGLDREKGVCLGCGWIDLDQDCDLDLILCRYAESPEAAALFAGESPKGGGLVVFENVGLARPVPAGSQTIPLTLAFKPNDRVAKAAGPCPAVSFVAADLDGDRDIDLLVLADGMAPFVIDNDRLMRFRRVEPKWAEGHKHRWNGGLAFVATQAERADLFLVPADAPPIFVTAKGASDYARANTNSPQLRQAVTVDIDLDGWPDVIGAAKDVKPALLQNLGDSRLEHKAESLPKMSAIAIASADFDSDSIPDLLVWSEEGLSLQRSQGNGNVAVVIEATGLRDKGSAPPPQRTNSDGIGCRVIAMAGPHWTAAERTTNSAGLGQSVLPSILGMGKAERADAVLLHWPDGVIQGEVNVAVGRTTRIVEHNWKPTSCPVLLTWDGERFVFVTDFLGAGSMGESSVDGSTRPPRPEESIKIEPGQLKAKSGQYVLKVTEPMDEVVFLDHLQLTVVDHPAGTAVHPDERFATSDPQPTQELLAFRAPIHPKKATDHRGTDVTERLLKRDRRAVDNFATSSWLGFAEPHALTLDFGELPKAEGRRWYLVMAGWTEYPFPESMYAAERAGVAVEWPVLEKLAADGKTWEPLGDLGFPAGLPRVMTREVPGLKPGEKCSLRIRTNLQIYWDEVYLAPAEDVGMRVHTLDVSKAELASRGMIQEIHPDGRPPVAYDDSKTEAVPVTKWKGKLTRLGDVTELLTKADDRFVVFGPGDEVTVHFDACKLPEVPAGWERSFVLRSRGYSKDSVPTTQTGGTVGPLPFRAMKNYPDFGGVQPPKTDAEKWNTRPAGGR
jgi:tetratricopeptide (TPR) repeat protein